MDFVSMLRPHHPNKICCSLLEGPTLNQYAASLVVEQPFNVEITRFSRPTPTNQALRSIPDFIVLFTFDLLIEENVRPLDSVRY